MKVLLVGGAGHVGTFITPYLRPRHTLRVLDLRPPTHEGLEFVQGSVTDPEALRRFLYLAQEAGVKRGVYTSTMSVHFRKRESYPAEELVPLDTPSVYGLSKGFGELVCAY